MTEDEIRAFVTGAVESGQVLDVKAYSRMTGVKASKLARWIVGKHFEMRAAREGISADRLDGLSDSARAALQVARLRTVFTEITMLAIEARVPAVQLKAIIAEANTASSETEALAVVDRARAIRSDDIKAIAAGFKTPRRRSAGSALHIGGLLHFEVADLLDVSPDKRGEMLARMSRLRERLEGALARACVEWEMTEAGQGSSDPVRPHLAPIR